MKISATAAITAAVALAVIAIPCCEAGCGETGPWDELDAWARAINKDDCKDGLDEDLPDKEIEEEVARCLADKIGDEESITTNLPYGTVCEALWSEWSAWTDCIEKASEDATDEEIDDDIWACVDEEIGFTAGQYTFYMDKVLGCKNHKVCVDACVKHAEEEEQCVTDDAINRIKKYREDYIDCEKEVKEENDNLSDEKFDEEVANCLDEKDANNQNAAIYNQNQGDDQASGRSSGTMRNNNGNHFFRTNGHK